MHKLILIPLTAFLLGCSSNPDSPTEGIVPEIQEVNAEFDRVEKLCGKIIHSEWQSEFLNENRSITTYLPPGYSPDSDYGALFVTDNVAIPLALCVEYLILQKEIEPIIIVGINLREPQPVDSIFGEYFFDFRALEFFKSEYLHVQNKSDLKRLQKGEMSVIKNASEFEDNPDLLRELGCDEIVSNRYERYTSYIVNEVIPFTRKNYSMSEDESKWTLGGFSNGGAFVYSFTCDYPGIFGNAIVMSPAGPLDEYNFSKSASKYFLACGNQESFLKESLEYIPEFEKLGIWFTHKTYAAGHDWQMWLTFYLESIQYIYKK